MFSKYPVIGWIATVITIVSFSSMAAGIWWYAQDDRERSISQGKILKSISDKQTEMKETIDIQTNSIKEIRTTQSNILEKVDKVEGDLDRGVDRISDKVHDFGRTISIELGRVSERQHGGK